MDEEGSSTGRSEAREGPREEKEGSAGRNKAWEGATGEGISGKGLTEAGEAWEGWYESRESSIAPVEGPHEP
jgi:hypothetical protein